MSIFFFEAHPDTPGDRYAFYLDAIRRADQSGMHALWVPERHFMHFGGLFPSPSVAAAAAAVATDRIRIRAGSVVLPLNDPTRVAEQWAMIDNFSRGRVDLAFASGWHPLDFVLASPDTYANRRQVMFEGIEIIRRLWRGERIAGTSGTGVAREFRILPPLVQSEPGIWLTGGSPETFESAAVQGFNVLTANFMVQKLNRLAELSGRYQERMMELHGRRGVVSLMVHAYAAASEADVEETARPAVDGFMRSFVRMLPELDDTPDAQRVKNLGPKELEQLIQMRVSRILRGELSLIGDGDHCRSRATAMKAHGADELACLVDFGVPHAQGLASIERLAALF